MKKIYLTILFFLCVIYGYSQPKQSVYSKLTPAVSEIERQSLLNGITALTMNFGGTIAYDSKTSSNNLDNYLQPANVQDKLTLSLLRKYKSTIANYLSDIIGFGDNEAKFYYESKEKVPVTFDSYNGSLTFFQGGIFFNSALNTFKLNTDQRASYIVKEVIVPSLSNFGPMLKAPEIKYFTLCVGYLAKDFSDENAKGDAETTAIIVSKSILEKYINAQITDEVLIKSSAFYNSNKNTNGKIRKVLIKL